MNFVFSAESNKRSFLSQAPVQILWSIFTNLLLQHSKFIGSSEKTLLPGSCSHCKNWCLGDRSDLKNPPKTTRFALNLEQPEFQMLELHFHGSSIRWTNWCWLRIHIGFFLRFAVYSPLFYALFLLSLKFDV